MFFCSDFFIHSNPLIQNLPIMATSVQRPGTSVTGRPTAVERFDCGSLQKPASMNPLPRSVCQVLHSPRSSEMNEKRSRYSKGCHSGPLKVQHQKRMRLSTLYQYPVDLLIFLDREVKIYLHPTATISYILAHVTTSP